MNEEGRNRGGGNSHWGALVCFLGLDASNRPAIDQEAEHAVNCTVWFSQSLLFFFFFFGFAAISACSQGRVLTLLFTSSSPSIQTLFAFTWTLWDEISCLVFARNLKFHVHPYVIILLSSRLIHIHFTNWSTLNAISHGFLSVFRRNPPQKKPKLKSD